jgi:hypothetical protein
MKKLFKIVLVLVGLGALLLLAGSVALRIYLPPEKAKALVLDRLSRQLQRAVQIDSVSVGLLSGLQVSHLKISESPDFAKGVFLSSDQFSFKIALAPLLFHKVIVRQIVLKKPEVTIIRGTDGRTFNFSDLTGSTAPSAPAGEEKNESLPFLLLVSRAEIQKGALHFIDHSSARQSMDIAPFDLKLKNVSLTSPFTLETGLHVKAKGTDLALALAGQADLLQGTFKIKHGSLVSRNTKIVLSGALSGLKTAEPVVDLKVDIPQLRLADMAAFFSLPPTVKIDKPLKGSLSVKGDQKVMELQSQLSLGAIQTTGHGQIHDVSAKQPTLSFHLETNSFPVAEGLNCVPGALPQGITLTGNTRLSADFSGTQAGGDFAIKCLGTDLVIAQTGTFSKPAGMPLDFYIIGEIASLAPLKVLIKSLSIQLASNALSASGSYETRGAQGMINFVAKAVNWSVADLAKVSPLLAPYHPTGSLSFDLHDAGPSSAPQTSLQTTGDVSMANIKQTYYEGQDAHLKWNLTEVTPDLSKVSGTASLKQGPGKILNVDKLAAGSRLAKIVLAPLETLAKLQSSGVLANMNLPSLQTITFESIVGDYVLRSGVVNIKTFDLNGQALSVQNTGTVGLAGAQPINLSVVMKLAQGSGGSLGQFITDEKGRPTLKFIATGSVANPQVKLDVKDVGKKAVQQAGQQLLKNPDVQNAVNNLLKGIFH